MKKALALTLIMVLGLSFGLVAQSIGGDFSAGGLSGSWNTVFSIGFTDVVITDPGATLVIPGATYEVTEGFVTIPDQLVSGTYLGESYSVTHPGGTYTVGPWNITIPGGTYDVTVGSVTIPEQIIPVQLPDGPVEVTLPAYTFEIPDFLNKECDLNYVATIDVEDPDVEWQIHGIHPYTVEVITGLPYDSDAGVTIVDYDAAASEGNLGTFDWCLLEFSGSGTTGYSFASDVQIPIGAGLFQTLTFNFTVAPGSIDQDDWKNGLTLVLVATQTDSLLRVWEATITVVVNFDLTDAALLIPINTLLGTCIYDGKTLNFENGVAMDFPVIMPAGWPYDLGSWNPPPTCRTLRPEVTVGYDNQGWVYEGADLMGPCLLDFPALTFDVNDTGFVEIDLDGTGLFATFEAGTQTVTLPAQTLTGTYTGGTVDITIPSQTVAVSAQTVTIPAYSFTVPADTIVIPDFTFTITIADQIIPITIAGGTYNVYSASLQTVTIPSQTVLVPGWTQTITDVVTLGVKSTLTVDYAIGDWVFGMVLVVDETGMTGLDFSADGILGAFSFASSLGFDPALVAFEEWNVVAGVSIAGITFSSDFTLVPNDVSLVLTGSGIAGAVSLSVEMSFGVPANEACDLNWAGIEIAVGFPFYCADLDAVLIFDCEGFDSMTFSVDGIVVPSFSWITIDADLTFTVDAKTLVISPDVSFGAGVCIDLYMDLGYNGDGPLTITDFTIYGLKIVADFNGVTFTGLSSFDEVNFNLVKNPYWEVYTIATKDDGCCGPFAFDVSVYFLEGGVRLFDIAYLEANVSLQIASQLTFTTGVELDIENENFTLWSIGLDVTW